MANLRLEQGGPNNPLPPLVALLPGGLLVMGDLSSWFVFAGLLFGLFFLAESVGRLGRYDR